MKKIVVTGANGMVGTSIVRKLCKDYDVLAIDRKNGRIADLMEPQNHMHFVASDILSIHDWDMILGGAYAVVHLAANVHWTPRTSEEIDSFYKVNVEGTRILIDKSAQYGVKKFLFFSTNDVYKNSDREIDENEPTDASSVYARSKLKAEEYIRNRYGSGSLDVLILRPASIYGEYDRGSMSSLISLCRNGIVPVLGAGDNIKALSYVKDIADFLRAYVEAEEVSGVSLANIASGNYSFRQMVNTINDVFGLNGKIIKLPSFLKDSTLLSKSRVFEKLKVASESKRINLSNIERRYGFSSSYSLGKGLIDSAEYYRKFCKLRNRTK